MKSSRKPVVVVQDKTKPIAAEIIAQSILDISKGMKALNETRLTRRAIVVLIKDNSNVPKHTIECVLNNLDALERIWLK